MFLMSHLMLPTGPSNTKYTNPEPLGVQYSEAHGHEGTLRHSGYFGAVPCDRALIAGPLVGTIRWL